MLRIRENPRPVAALPEHVSRPPVNENVEHVFQQHFRAAKNSQETIDTTCFTKHLKVKKHKLFRGIRCWLSYQFCDRHSVKEGNPIEKAKGIMKHMQDNPNSAAVVSLGKSGHNLMIINHGSNFYSISSTEYVVFGAKEKDFAKIEKTLADTLSAWGDNVSEDNIVYLRGLNTDKMWNHICKNHLKEKIKYNCLSYNCSRHIADLMLAGFDDDDKNKLQHNRPWQMPANTLELAKELHNKFIS